jgi:hypothetical protein
VDVGVVGAGVQAQVRQAVKHRVKQHPHLQPRQVHAQAQVRPVPERHVRLRVAEDVEGAGIPVSPGVTVRGSERDRDQGTPGNRDAAEFDILGRHAGDGQQRRLPPQRFFYRLRHQAPVGADGVQLPGTGEQPEQQIAGGAVCRLRAGRKQQQQERVDLLVAEPVPPDLGPDQLAHQVRARVPAPVGNDLREVGPKLRAGGDSPVPVAHHRDQLT